jgi:hypothetical protein
MKVATLPEDRAIEWRGRHSNTFIIQKYLSRVQSVMGRMVESCLNIAAINDFLALEEAGGRPKCGVWITERFPNQI